MIEHRLRKCAGLCFPKADFCVDREGLILLFSHMLQVVHLILSVDTANVDYLAVTCILLFICRKNSIKQPVYEIVSA